MRGGLAVAALALAACARGEPEAPAVAPALVLAPQASAPDAAAPDAAVPDAAVPEALRELHDPGLDPAGTWLWNWGWWSRTALWARRDGEALELEFRQRTDVGPRTFTSRALWTGAGWRLETPGGPHDFRMLYPVHLDGEEGLVPDTALDDFAPGQLTGFVDADGEIEDCAFRRCAPEHLAAWREGDATADATPSGR